MLGALLVSGHMIPTFLWESAYRRVVGGGMCSRLEKGFTAECCSPLPAPQKDGAWPATETQSSSPAGPFSGCGAGHVDRDLLVWLWIDEIPWIGKTDH